MLRMNNASIRVKVIGIMTPQLKAILLALTYSSSCLSSQTARASELSSILKPLGLLNWAYSFNCGGEEIFFSHVKCYIHIVGLLRA